MLIKNITQNSIIATNARIADNFVMRLKGLLGVSHLENGGALVIRPCNSVHTLGMKFAIDVVFLDRHDKVVKIINNMNAGRLSICWHSNYVIELPAGVANSTKLKVGDIISIF